jgi:hypothetical protein
MNKQIQTAIGNLLAGKVGTFSQQINSILNSKVNSYIQARKKTIFGEDFKSDPGTQKFKRLHGWVNDDVIPGRNDGGMVKDHSASAGNAQDPDEIDRDDPDSIDSRLKHLSLGGSGIRVN